jgi:hypothetical protein
MKEPPQEKQKKSLFRSKQADKKASAENYLLF